MAAAACFFFIRLATLSAVEDETGIGGEKGWGRMRLV